MSSRRWPTIVAAVALTGTVVALGVANPVPPARVSTDRLGPDAGEPVAEYLDRANASLVEDAGPDAGAEHWALVSLDAPATASTLLDTVGDLRVSQVMFRVPIERVQTPIVTIPVAANRESVERASTVASARLSMAGAGVDRQSQVMAYSAARLSTGCTCVVGAVVRGSLAQLRALAATPTARAVEALPADAVAGAFAVSPLLPSQTTVVVPGPDDGPVPALP
ncbi:hypothetical protein [Rhodococcus sp. AG1013]|uniref:hypothetical protein n=1 Tax=unclassified Rhodococcus (in: high G+C Gram-positive bacteria) TaxID=192944 RepID=UPI000E09FC5E|nr:hypothetical protein [Rhodococcus sp. AG1013]RDI32634.1 hypothetical protein DEU38_103371 [Rhodococcus sp. AG1013]